MNTKNLLFAVILFSASIGTVPEVFSEGDDIDSVTKRFGESNQAASQVDFNRKRECALQYHPKLGKNKNESLYQKCLDETFAKYEEGKKERSDKFLEEVKASKKGPK